MIFKYSEPFFTTAHYTWLRGNGKSIKHVPSVYKCEMLPSTWTSSSPTSKEFTRLGKKVIRVYVKLHLFREYVFLNSLFISQSWNPWPDHLPPLAGYHFILVDSAHGAELCVPSVNVLAVLDKICRSFVFLSCSSCFEKI